IGWKKIFHANGHQKKAGVAILLSDKIDFKMKNILRDKEGHYLMIKGSIQGEDITILSIYAPNIGSPQYIRQLLTTLKGEINKNTIIVGDFNTPLTAMDRSSRQKINKETQALNEPHFSFSGCLLLFWVFCVSRQTLKYFVLVL
uniref:Endonuclease/exonuclease/phosphatase domain-containing protein n=1 Tax=Catagonus wagneri TaxID=51154 RepID=A0A8C3W4D8_9CETA